MRAGASAALSVALNQRWVELPVREAVASGEWAARVVDELLALRGLREPAAVRHLYVQTWAALVDQLRGRADVPGSQVGAAWGLVADADLLPVTVVEAALHLLDEGGTLDGFVEQAIAAPQDRFAPPDVSELSTAAGTAVRVQQLRVVEERGAGSTVQTSVVHVWPGPDPDTALTFTAWFDSPVEAELSREVVDALAASLQVETSGRKKAKTCAKLARVVPQSGKSSSASRAATGIASTAPATSARPMSRTGLTGPRSTTCMGTSLGRPVSAEVQVRATGRDRHRPLPLRRARWLDAVG